MRASSFLNLSVCVAPLLAACSYEGEVVGYLNGTSAGEGGNGGLVDTNPSAGMGGGGRTFILGADLSWVQEEEEGGAVYLDGGVERDILAILKDHGFNYVRLRLFHDPSSPCRTSASGDETCGYQFEFGTRAEPYCDLEHTIAMARRVKAAGLGLLLDLHYSDTWADPDDQNKPLAWEALDFPTLTAAVEEYARQTLLAFRAAGAPPDIVQIGNEITEGMLFPDGSSSAAGNFGRFATLVKAGLAGAKAAEPNVRTMLHIEKPDNFTKSDWWLANLREEGVEFDILGQSCFPEWHGTSADWIPTFTELADKYPDLDLLVAEYSQEKRAVNEMVFGLPEARGLGTFIWEPTAWGETLFDRDGNQFVSNDWLSLYDEMAEDYGAR